MSTRLFNFVLIWIFVVTGIVPNAFAQAVGARVIYTEGLVEIMRQGDVNWKMVYEGMSVLGGDRIRTSAASAVEIVIDGTDENVIRLNEGGELTLNNIGKAMNKKTTLLSGKIFALMDSLAPGSDFEVTTPTAVCGVAGSGMTVDADSNTTTVGCHEDEAYTKGINKDSSHTPKKVIGEGYKSLVEKFKVPGELLPLTEDEKKDWKDFKDGIKDRLGKKGTSRAVIDRIKKLQERSDKRKEIQRDDTLERREQQRREEVVGRQREVY